MWAALSRKRGLRELFMIAVVYSMYDASRFIVEGHQTTALQHAIGVLHLENMMDIAWEQTINAYVSTHEFLAVPADYMYATLHYLVTPIVLVWMWRCHRNAYPRARTSDARDDHRSRRLRPDAGRAAAHASRVRRHHGAICGHRLVEHGRQRAPRGR